MNTCGHNAPHKAKGLCANCYSRKRQTERYQTDPAFREMMKANQKRIRTERREDPTWKELRKKYTNTHIEKVGIEEWRRKQRERQSLHYARRRATEVLSDLAKLVPFKSAEIQFRDTVIRTHIRTNDPLYDAKLTIYKEVWGTLRDKSNTQ